jgi:hypothetical protein
MPGLTSSSLAWELGRRDEPPSTAAVAEVGAVFARALATHLDTDLRGTLPPDVDPVGERATLDGLIAVPAA